MSAKSGKKRKSFVPLEPFPPTSEEEDIKTILEFAVEENDVGTIGKIMLNDTIAPARDMAWAQAPDIYDRGRDMFQKWKENLGDKGKFDIWKDNVWNCASILRVMNKSVFFVHYDGWGSKFDEEVDTEQYLILPAHTMTKAKRTPVTKKRTFFAIEEVPVEAVAATPTAADLIIEEGVGVRTSGGRTLRGKRSQTSADVPEESGEQVLSSDVSTKKKTRKKKQDDLEEEADWVCTICRQMEAEDGSDLLLCEGGCKRSYHFNCLGLKEEEVAGPDSPPWMCDDCTDRRHTCALCGDEGPDDLAVKRCSCPSCGLFYHRICVESHRHAVIRYRKDSDKQPEQDAEPEQTSVPCSSPPPVPPSASPAAPPSSGKRSIRKPSRFIEEEVESTSPRRGDLQDDEEEKEDEMDQWGRLELVKCPSHFCETCFDVYGSEERGRGKLIRCSRCPKAFHHNCIPPDARFNQHMLLCGDHQDEMLPSTDYVSLEGACTSLSFNYAFEQMLLTESRPNASSLMDSNHFRLPLSFKKEIASRPPAFQMITRSDETALRKDDKEEPLPPGVPRPTLPVHAPDVACSCKEKCDDDCLNRMSKIECSERGNKGQFSICNIGGKQCGNRQFASRDYVKVMAFQEGEMGWGLKVREDVPVGALVIEYVGEVITQAQMKRRMLMQRELTPNDHDFYIMEIENGFYVDGKHKGNLSRFINHSCDPNCELQRWVVKDRIRIGIFAIKDIACDEPLCYDYQFDTQESETFKCHCGAKTCRGTMAPKKKSLGSKETLSKEQKQRLIAAGRKRENRSEKVKDEWKRSCTGKFLPGDSILEIKNGPPRKSFAVAREQKIFLVRNVRNSVDFERRRDLLFAKRSAGQK